MALIVGTVELVGLAAERLSLDGSFWVWVEGIDMSTLGYVTVGRLAATWCLSLLIWRLARIEERWSREASRIDPAQ